MFRSKRPKEKREFHPRSHGAVYAIAAFYLCTLIYDLIRSYLAGGEEAPTPLFLAVGTAVLGGGVVLLAVFAWKMFHMPPVTGGEEEEEPDPASEEGQE